MRYLVLAGLLIVTAFHALFAFANFDIGEPAEGAVVSLAAASLLAGIVLVAKQRDRSAALMILGGTLALTIWFVVTVPQGMSDASLLYLSLVVPGCAATYLTYRRATGGNGDGARAGWRRSGSRRE